MLTEIYIEALLVDKELADQVREAWNSLRARNGLYLARKCGEMNMGVINVNFKRPKLRADVVAEQFDLEIDYIQVLQALNNVLSNVNESRRQLNEVERKELCRRLRVTGEDWLADYISR